MHYAAKVLGCGVNRSVIAYHGCQATLNTHFYLGNSEPREDLLNGNKDNSEGLKYPRVASIESNAYHGCLSWPFSTTLNTRFFLGNTGPREDLLNGNSDNSEGLKYPRVASIESECLSWPFSTLNTH